MTFLKIIKVIYDLNVSFKLRNVKHRIIKHSCTFYLYASLNERAFELLNELLHNVMAWSISFSLLAKAAAHKNQTQQMAKRPDLT